MPFAAALSTVPDTALAIREICEHVRTGLAGKPDLALVFFTPHHLETVEILRDSLRDLLAPGTLLGCVAEGVIGNDREVQGQPAVSLWAARWARSVRVTPMHLSLEHTADGPSLFGWPDALRGEPTEPFMPARSAVLLLGDPFTFPTDAFLAQMRDDAPGVPVQGGMASGIDAPGQCRLVLNETVHGHGAVGVLLEGELGMRGIVSQGCRPIGRPYVITKADRNIILELSGKTPYDQLRELWPTLSGVEQQLFQRGLHLGRVLNEYQAEFQRGDFLIRNVVGIEPKTGALVVGDHVRVGQTVQFQVRDAASAEEDLHALLQLDLSAHESKPAGALVFSCNGRGSRFFDKPDHDARAVRQEAGPVPLAGFFAMGELGPVGGQNFIHGYTASVALFSDE